MPQWNNTSGRDLLNRLPVYGSDNSIRGMHQWDLLLDWRVGNDLFEWRAISGVLRSNVPVYRADNVAGYLFE